MVPDIDIVGQSFHNEVDQSIRNKLNTIQISLRSFGKAAVALSGGVDSTLLLKLAVETLGSNNVLAITACTPIPGLNQEADDAAKVAEGLGVKHLLFCAGEYADEGFLQNTRERCYLCKKLIFGGIVRLAAENGIAVVIEGTNVDDQGDFRPGMKALAELGIQSPLRKAGLGKSEIRKLAEIYGLEAWDKPSNACLATRFPYGTRISMENVVRVGKAEQILQGNGFRQVRVRFHGNIARIELEPSEMPGIFQGDIADTVYTQFRALGFDYTAIDLKGYRTGSLNER